MGDIITNKQKFIDGWHSGLPETPCGMGSRKSECVKQIKWIPEIVERYNIKSICDIGAGDLNWWNDMEMPDGVVTAHYDLVVRHEDVTEFDIVNQVPPKSDLIVVMWVLNHIPKDQCEAAIKNIKASGSKYLMMTDRPIWHHEQPEALMMPYIESIIIRPVKEDKIVLIDLEDL